MGFESFVVTPYLFLMLGNDFLKFENSAEASRIQRVLTLGTVYTAIDSDGRIVNEFEPFQRCTRSNDDESTSEPSALCPKDITKSIPS